MEVAFERLADFWAAGSSTALGLLQGTVAGGSALEAVFVELHLLLGSVDVPVCSCELFDLVGKCNCGSKNLRIIAGEELKVKENNNKKYYIPMYLYN